MAGASPKATAATHAAIDVVNTVLDHTLIPAPRHTRGAGLYSQSPFQALSSSDGPERLRYERIHKLEGSYSLEAGALSLSRAEDVRSYQSPWSHASGTGRIGAV